MMKMMMVSLPTTINILVSLLVYNQLQSSAQLLLPVVTATSSSSSTTIHADGRLEQDVEEEANVEVESGIDDGHLHQYSLHRRRVPDDCQLVYAPRSNQNDLWRTRIDRSNINDNNLTTITSAVDENRFTYFDPTDWGVFTLVPISKGTPVYRTYGDIVIQVPDRLSSSSSLSSSTQRQKLQAEQGGEQHDENVDDYVNNVIDHMRTWNGRETGGQWEGRYNVDSVVPGIAMMASAVVPGISSSSTQHHQQQYEHEQRPNILPLVPRVDEGGLTRIDSPGAGAITHYHNYTWWYARDVNAGEELLLMDPSRHGRTLEKKNIHRQAQQVNDDGEPSVDIHQDSIQPPPSPSLDRLKSYGYCLDNIRARKSRVKGAGRGAFATKYIPAGSVVAPYPMIPIHRNELLIDAGDFQQVQGQQKQGQGQRYQLLLNYCLSHNSSSDWLYFPYSPMVNLINHYHEPNVKLVILSSTSSTNNQTVNDNGIRREDDGDGDSQAMKQPSPSSLRSSRHRHVMLELVATRDIGEGEELYLDYGRSWEDAWWKHVENWQPYNPNDHYAPAYVVDDTVRLIRTEQEQKSYIGAEYAHNVITTCFYRYSDRSEEERREAQERNSLSRSRLSDDDGDETAMSNGKKKSEPSVRTFRWEMTKGLFELKNLRPCKVLKRMEDSKGRSVYAVRMMNHPSLPPEEQIPGGDDELHLVTHIPRIAIRFSDKAGTTDQHLPNAFRHEIGLHADTANQVRFSRSELNEDAD